MNDPERRADAPAAHARLALTEDLPYKAEWIDGIKNTYTARLKETTSPKERKAFDAALPKLTSNHGLFINILMQGRKQMEKDYLTFFMFFEKHNGQTDQPNHEPPPPYVRIHADLIEYPAQLEATLIHEYTHLATIQVYKNFGYPWLKDSPEEKTVKEKLLYTYPEKDNGQYIHWKKWLDTLDPSLRSQVTSVLDGFASYSHDSREREALPHVIEIIYHLYAAKVEWWTIKEGPIFHVADLLAKFKYA